MSQTNSASTTDAKSQSGLLSGPRGEYFRIALVSVQIWIWMLVIKQFHILEDRSVPALAVWLLPTFILHALAPKELRKAIFLATAFAAIFFAFGLAAGGGLIVAGSILVGLCHLPIPFNLRIVVVLLATLGLGLVRARYWTPPGAAELWLPVFRFFAAIFMFKLIVYLYDLKNSPTKDGPIHRLAYFFQPPVPSFLMQPVIDYRNFGKVWYDKPSTDIYQKGIHWMFRGATHLIFYKICYHYVAFAPSQVEGATTFWFSVVSSFLLLTRISGEFHILIGILCLFGFNLQRSHHNFFLAQNFSEVWRRINVYWRDFMTKIAFYPTYVRVKKLKPTTAVAISTCVGFVATWFFHGYQFFWLVGKFRMTAVDITFWAILGVFVLASSIIQMTAKRKRLDPKAPWSFQRALIVSLKTSAVFLTMCVLLNFWECQTFAEWQSNMAIASSAGVFSSPKFYLGFLLFPVFGIALHCLNYYWRKIYGTKEPSFLPKAGLVAASGLALVAISSSTGMSMMPTTASDFVLLLGSRNLNQRDSEKMEQSYYDSSLGNDDFTSQRWRLQSNRPDDWVPFAESELADPIDDPILQYTIKPNVKNGKFHRESFSSNRWGMRDQDYELEKPAGALRLALFGSSYSFGSGCAQEDAYEKIIERWLNAEHAGAAFKSYEILNFSVPGYTTVHRALVGPEKIAAFKPDIVFLTFLDRDDSFTISRIARPISRGVKLPPALDDIRRRAGVDESMSQEEMISRLDPFVDEITLWTWKCIEDACHEIGAKPVLLTIFAGNEKDRAEAERQIALARKNTSFHVLRLDGAFDGYSLRMLKVAPWDQHPNALGHSLLAASLKQALIEANEVLGLGLKQTTVKDD